MVERNWGGTMVLTEPDAGSDVGAGVTKAIHLEGDTYHIEGVKRFITAGEHDATDNIIHFVLARVPGGRAGHQRVVDVHRSEVPLRRGRQPRDP